MSEYHDYLKSAEWAERRRLVFRRENGKCERCSTTEGPFNVHHLTYERLYNESLDDLQLLCRDCHSFIHGHSAYDPLKRWAFIEAMLIVELHGIDELARRILKTRPGDVLFPLVELL